MSGSLLRKLLRLLVFIALFLDIPSQFAFTQAPTHAKTYENGTLLDINTATLEQLEALPGIGAGYAERILRYRPYRAKNQLAQDGIIPQVTYLKIRLFIIAKQRVK